VNFVGLAEHLLTHWDEYLWGDEETGETPFPKHLPVPEQALILLNDISLLNCLKWYHLSKVMGAFDVYVSMDQFEDAFDHRSYTYAPLLEKTLSLVVSTGWPPTKLKDWL